ncbi:MAG TPA: molybdenum cofactor biosynthesis F family protein [Kineosporiaceae bacterium]|nr:molybdenum cofactor biosynthesis F family protein [Kineosporiaceae bacterium]
MNQIIAPDPRVLSGQALPEDWKGMDDFARGIDGNRLPTTGALAGTALAVEMDGRPRLDLRFSSVDQVQWTSDSDSGTDWYEAVEMRPGLLYLTFTYTADPLRAVVLVVNRNAGRTLLIESRIGPEPTPGRPRVDQTFVPGHLVDVVASGPEPGPTRDLIGWRALYRYSPNHLYEHVYLSSERYAWQCLQGEQRGHGDVDLATTWSLGDTLYVFTFREFLIPVAATWLYDLDALRTVGTFFGLGDGGSVRCAPGGALITPLGRVAYPDEQPV